MRFRSFVLFAVAGSLVVASNARAQAPSPSPDDCATTDSLVAFVVRNSNGRFTNGDFQPVYSISSGAVSLGSYQAGRLHEWMNRRRAAFAALRHTAAQCPYAPDWQNHLQASSLNIRVAVGASAGAINSLLVALEACRDDDDVLPADSLLFLTWVAIGFRNDTDILDGPGTRTTSGLLEGDDANEQSLFNPKVLERVRTILSTYLVDGPPESTRPTTWPKLKFRPGCNIGLGHTLLRSKARFVEVNNNGKQQKVAKVLTDRILTMLTDGASSDRSKLKLDLDSVAYRHLKDSGRYVELKVRPDENEAFTPEEALDNILRSYQAAGAFPVAFPLVGLEGLKSEDTVCSEDVPGKDPNARGGKGCGYLDGGGLNNNPIDIALDRMSLPGTSHGKARFVFLDQDLTPFPAIEKEKETKGTTFFANMQNYIGDGPEVATSQQMAAGVQEALSWPLAIEVEVIDRSSATFGEYLAAMTAFPDYRLRAADFLVGMRDTWLEAPQAARSTGTIGKAADAAYERASPLPLATAFATLASGKAGVSNGVDVKNLPGLVRVLGEHGFTRRGCDANKSPACPAVPPLRRVKTDELDELQKLVKAHDPSLWKEMLDAPESAYRRHAAYSEAQSGNADVASTAFWIGGAAALASVLPAASFDRVHRQTPQLTGWGSMARIGVVTGFTGGVELSIVAAGNASLPLGCDTGWCVPGYVGPGLLDALRLRVWSAGFGGWSGPAAFPTARIAADLLPIRVVTIQPWNVPGLNLSFGGSPFGALFTVGERVEYAPAVLLELSIFSRLVITGRHDWAIGDSGMTGGFSFGIGYRP